MKYFALLVTGERWAIANLAVEGDEDAGIIAAELDGFIYLGEPLV